MDTTNTGGPAFPLKEALSNDNLGMTLRDYFAAKALPAVISQAQDGISDRFPHGNFRHPEYQGQYMTTAQWWAEQAYQIADAMLAARGAA